MPIVPLISPTKTIQIISQDSINMCMVLVYADVIEALKEPNGWFSCFSIQTPRGISDMLHLYRCSQTAFPSESDIMDEANQFARTQLSRALLLEEWDPLLQIDNVRREVR